MVPEALHVAIGRSLRNRETIVAIVKAYAVRDDEKSPVVVVLPRLARSLTRTGRGDRFQVRVDLRRSRIIYEALPGEDSRVAKGASRCQSRDPLSAPSQDKSPNQKEVTPL